MKRNYKITPENRSYGTIFKVESWNDFGMKRTVYERNVMDASRIIMDWWENSQKEYDKMTSLDKAIAQCVEIDRKAGRLPSLD